MQISLSPEMEKLINQQLANGYRSPEEVVAASLRLLQKLNEKKLQELREEIMPALEELRRGEGKPFDRESIEAIKAAGRERLNRKSE